MADPLLFPDNQAAAIRRLEERIRTLESTNRLLSSSIKDGALSIYDATGTKQAVIGRQADGTYGVLVGSGVVPALDLDNVNGMSYPQIPVTFVTAPVGTTITSGTFVDIPPTATHVGLSHKGLYMRIGVATDAGTTGEVLIRRQGGATSASQAVPSDSFLLNLEFWWLHQATLGTNAQFLVQARRASGTGAFVIGTPTFAALIGPEHCSTAGTFVA